MNELTAITAVLAQRERMSRYIDQPAARRRRPNALVHRSPRPRRSL